MFSSLVYFALFIVGWGLLTIVLSFVSVKLNKETIKSIAKEEAESIMSEYWFRKEDVNGRVAVAHICKLFFLYRCVRNNTCGCLGCSKSSTKTIREVVSEKLYNRINSIKISRNFIVNKAIKRETGLAILSEVFSDDSSFRNVKIVPKDTDMKSFKFRN